MDYTALLVTAKLAACVTPLLLLVSFPVAYFLAYSTMSGRRFIEAAVNLPVVMPPTVLGLGLLMTFGPRSPLGAGWEGLTGSPLVFSFAGLVFGSMIYSLPFAVLPLRTAFEKIDPGIFEAARSQGMNGYQVFRYMILPNSRGGLLASAALVFAHTVGEFGVALMIGGSIPGETRVASIAIFEHAEMLDYHAAGLLSLVMLLVSYGVLLFMGTLNGVTGGKPTCASQRKETPQKTARTSSRLSGEAAFAQRDAR